MPAGPLSLRTASARVISRVLAPSMLCTRSPARMPARSPGESAMGAITVRNPPSTVTSSPTPSNSPLVSSRTAR